MSNFSDIIETLISTNNKLITGEISIEIAKQVATNTQVLINAAKISLEYSKFKGEKENIFLESEPIEITLLKIEQKNKECYK